MTEPANHQDFERLKRTLQAFQSARLNDTYADLKNDPEYAKIGHFFFEKLYAPEDFSFRDTRFYPDMSLYLVRCPGR